MYQFNVSGVCGGQQVPKFCMLFRRGKESGVSEQASLWRKSFWGSVRVDWRTEGGKTVKGSLLWSRQQGSESFVPLTWKWICFPRGGIYTQPSSWEYSYSLGFSPECITSVLCWALSNTSAAPLDLLYGRFFLSPMFGFPVISRSSSMSPSFTLSQFQLSTQKTARAAASAPDSELSVKFSAISQTCSQHDSNLKLAKIQRETAKVAKCHQSMLSGQPLES